MERTGRAGRLALVLALALTVFGAPAEEETPAAPSVPVETPESVMLAEDLLVQAGPGQRAYAHILLHPEEHRGLYAVTEHVPSDCTEERLASLLRGGRYVFALQDIDRDGKTELLLGQGLDHGAPQVLLNILRFDGGTGEVADVDGARTYPLMDGLTFYANGYFATQNGAGGLYTECWKLDGEPEAYWYGYERGGGFYDPQGREMTLWDYYELIGHTSYDMEWTVAGEAEVIRRVLLGDIGGKPPVQVKVTPRQAPDLAFETLYGGTEWAGTAWLYEKTGEDIPPVYTRFGNWDDRLGYCVTRRTGERGSEERLFLDYIGQSADGRTYWLEAGWYDKEAERFLDRTRIEVSTEDGGVTVEEREDRASQRRCPVLLCFGRADRPFLLEERGGQEGPGGRRTKHR